MHIHVEARDQHLMSSSITVYLNLWDKASHWTWILLIQWESTCPNACIPSSGVIYEPCYTNMLWFFFFNVDTVNSNLGLMLAQQVPYTLSHLSIPLSCILMPADVVSGQRVLGSLKPAVWVMCKGYQSKVTLRPQPAPLCSGISRWVGQCLS